MRKFLIALLLITVLATVFSISAFANGDVAANERGSVFEMLYTEVVRHSDKILSALAFVGSLLLAITYKKGLLPLMRGGLNTLGSTVASLKDETEKLKAHSNENIALAVERLDTAQKLTEALSQKLEALENELSAVNATQTKYADMKIIMKYQISMLYEVFMASSLPLYQKEAISEKIGEMKRLIAGEEDSGNE